MTIKRPACHFALWAVPSDQRVKIGAELDGWVVSCQALQGVSEPALCPNLNTVVDVVHYPVAPNGGDIGYSGFE